MKSKTSKIGFGGGCHWCTEAVFKVIKGVVEVEQGWVSSQGDNSSFSEAVIVHFDPKKIDLDILIDIHLRSHSSTSQHSMRTKYRSAIYFFSEDQAQSAKRILVKLQAQFDKQIITLILPFVAFRLNEEKYLNYYSKNSTNSFCSTYIDPKFRMLMKEFSRYTDIIVEEHK